jgi:hypothetical protein
VQLSAAKEGELGGFLAKLGEKGFKRKLIRE